MSFVTGPRFRKIEVFSLGPQQRFSRHAFEFKSDRPNMRHTSSTHSVSVTLRLRSVKRLEFCRRRPTASPHPQVSGMWAPDVSPGPAERSCLSLCVDRNASKSWRATFGPVVFQEATHGVGSDRFICVFCCFMMRVHATTRCLYFRHRQLRRGRRFSFGGIFGAGCARGGPRSEKERSVSRDNSDY